MAWMDQFKKGKKPAIAKGKKAVNAGGKLDKNATDPGKLGKLGQKPKLAPMFRNKK